MKHTQFEAAQQLKDRILQLKMLLEYMINFFELKPLSMEITVTVLNDEYKQKIPFLNGKLETYQHYLLDTSDGQFIIKQIESRISELEKEFDNL